MKNMGEKNHHTIIWASSPVFDVFDHDTQNFLKHIIWAYCLFKFFCDMLGMLSSKGRLLACVQYSSHVESKDDRLPFRCRI